MVESSLGVGLGFLGHSDGLLRAMHLMVADGAIGGEVFATSATGIPEGGWSP